MDKDSLTDLLSRRYSATQRPLGRLMLKLHVQQQRLRAQWLAHGTEALKRGFDILASFVLLLLFSPLLALIALAVQLEDGGPVFFSQIRVGRFGREFKMYKVRSMCLDAEKRLEDLLGQNHHKE